MLVGMSARDWNWARQDSAGDFEAFQKLLGVGLGAAADVARAR